MSKGGSLSFGEFKKFSSNQISKLDAAVVKKSFSALNPSEKQFLLNKDPDFYSSFLDDTPIKDDFLINYLMILTDNIEHSLVFLLFYFIY